MTYQSQEEINKQFDKESKEYVKKHGLTSITGLPAITIPKIAYELGFFEGIECSKSFFSRIRAADREAVIEMCEGMKKLKIAEHAMPSEGCMDCRQDISYNFALSSLITQLKNLPR